MPRTRQQELVIVDGPRLVSNFLVGEYFDMAKQFRKDLQCSICLESWMDCKRCACMMPCGHVYHYACYAQMRDTKCAVCRQ